MRCWVVLIFLVPGVHAVAWDDPVGDHEMAKAGVAWAPAPDGWYTSGDVVRLEMGEVDADHVWLEVELASLDGGAEPVPRNPMQFGFSEVGSPINRTWYIEETPYGAMVYFARDQETAQGNRLTMVLGGEATREDDIIRGVMSKGSFTTDAVGHLATLEPSPRAGFSVELQPWAGHRVGPIFGGAESMQVRDLLGPAKTMVFEVENARRGDMELIVPKPTRTSNGAATTYIFDVEATNAGAADHIVRMDASAPPQWVVRAPFELEVPAGQTVVVPVAVTVPFEHKHGVHKTATIRTIAEDGTEAAADVHVFWTDPPRPGGHHPRVALKTYEGLAGYYDTLPAPTTGTLAPDQQETSDVGAVRNVVSSWKYGQHRSYGLDFDGVGNVVGEVAFEVPSDSDVQITARLVLDDPRQVLAEQVIEGAWSAGIHLVAWDIPVLDDVDRFPPDEGGNMAFEFELEHQIVDPTAGAPFTDPPPTRMHMPDNWFRLPLVDYHEAVDLSAIGVALLSVYTEDPDRLVNPEEVAVIPFHVTNHENSARDLTWSLEGAPEWVRLEGAPARLGPGQNKSFSVIAAPGDLPDGTVAQVLVIARDVETGTESFGRVAVTVTTGQDLPNERLLAPEPEGQGERAPGSLGWILAALCLAGLGRARRP